MGKKLMIIGVVVVTIMVGAISVLFGLEKGTTSALRRVKAPFVVAKAPFEKGGPDTLSYDDGTPAYYWQLPDEYGDDLFNVRFTPAQACTLKSAWLLFYLAGSHGTPDLRVYIWDDVDGFPGTKIDSVDVPYGSIDFYDFGYWEVVDLSDKNIVIDPPADFHIGYTVINWSSGDTLSILSDDGNPTGSEHRSSEYWNGVWGTMYDDWGSDVNFFIRAVVGYGVGGDPDIRVEPDSLAFSLGTGSSESGSSIGHQSPSSKHDLDVKLPPGSSGYHALGSKIPEEIVQYWQNHTSPDYGKGETLKSSVDWSSYDSPINDQGQCGSCWACATVALLENLGNQAGLSDQDLSEQVLVSCVTQNNGCNGGWYGYALQYVNEDSLPPESCYPYTATDGNCDDKCNDPAFLEYVTQYDQYGLWGDPDENTVNNLRALLNDTPVLVHFYVPDDFFDYSGGGVYNYSGGWFDPTNRGHAVLVVGYDDVQQCFKVKNSWGSSWGENGYFRIAYDDVTDYVQFGGYACTASGVYKTGDNISSSFTVYNDGTGDLVVSNISKSSEWLSVSPTSFTVVPSNFQLVTVQVDTTELTPGTYSDRLYIYSNDPDESPYPDGVYVTLTIGGPSCDSLWVVSDNAFVGQMGKVIRVSGKNCSELSGYSICVKFDPDVLEADTLTLDGTRGEGAAMFTPGWTDTTAKAGVVYVYSCPGIPAGEGPLFNLVVNIKASAPVGPTTLELVDVPPALNRFSPCEGSAITPTLVNGTLNVGNEMFVRGDDDTDGELTISDPILSLCYQFADCAQPSCMDACDVDDDGEITISDPIRNLCYQFADCDPPPPPFPSCGPDPAEDGLDCVNYPPCGTKGLISGKRQISKSEGKIEVGKVSASMSGKVVIPVYLTNTQPLSGFAYTIRYDPTVLRTISAQNGGLVTEGFDFFSAKINNEEGWIKVGNVVSYGMARALPPGTYQVAKVIFQPKAKEIADNVALELADGQLVDTVPKLRAAELVNGLIKGTIGLPKAFDLSQNFPNPFNPVTEIPYQLPRLAKVTICIYNTMGQLVRTLVNAEQPAGFKTVRWYGRDDRGNDVSSGLYFCRIEANGLVKTRKLLLLR